MKSLLSKEYKKKLTLLEKYNRYYYQDQKPLVSDKIYDELKSEILEIEKKYGFSNLESPSIKVGYKPSKKFEKYKHMKNVIIIKCV